MLSPSNIIETGYAQPGRFVISSSQLPYSGFYYKDDKENYWSGKEPTFSSQLLTDLKPPVKPLTLNDLSKVSRTNKDFYKKYTDPLDTTLFSYDHVQPTSEDYFNGYFNRYIIQLKSSLIPERNIIEINKTNYDKLLSDYISLKSYNTAIVPWRLAGPAESYVENNITYDGVYDFNLRCIQQAEKIIIKLSLYLTDPLQFTNSIPGRTPINFFK